MFETLWLNYCKDHGMDSFNRHNYGIFVAGAKAEREIIEILLKKQLVDLDQRYIDGVLNSINTIKARATLNSYIYEKQSSYGDKKPTP